MVDFVAIVAAGLRTIWWNCYSFVALKSQAISIIHIIGCSHSNWCVINNSPIRIIYRIIERKSVRTEFKFEMSLPFAFRTNIKLETYVYLDISWVITIKLLCPFQISIEFMLSLTLWILFLKCLKMLSSEVIFFSSFFFQTLIFNLKKCICKVYTT